jgi:hypothetical protein
VSKGRKGRSPDQIRQDRAEIARLYLQRRTQAEIGQRLGLSRQQVGYELEAVRKEWLQSSLMDFNARRAEELARIDAVEQEYHLAWEASKKERQTSITEQITTPEGERLKAGIRKEEQTGDARYLEGVQRCIDQRCKILGLNAPQKIAPTTPDGREAYAPLTDAQRVAGIHRLLAGVETAGPGRSANGQAHPPSNPDSGTGDDPPGGGDDPGPVAGGAIEIL